jgi:hypothetical protein
VKSCSDRHVVIWTWKSENYTGLKWKGKNN